MKILPNYLIQYLPDIEDALEELRLSVLDHAYDLIKSLDINELSTDIIRQKLELCGLKVDNMSESWLPNGRFYQMYPSIKHNRTRYNAIQSIVKSGGQFEGLWSNDFSKKTEYNYNQIQLLRHTMLASGIDGYYYVSGDTVRNSDGSIASSALIALSSDILLNQALPAGYTYLYLPWPRPAFPSDAGYFYNVHMLDYDRLHYAIDCNTATTYDESVPASALYYDKNKLYTKTPYWFDYHYINNTYVTENGKYIDADGNETADASKAVFYKLNAILSDSNGIFPTKCYVYSRNKTTPPNRDIASAFTPNVENINNCLDEYYSSTDTTNKFGPYRTDWLCKQPLKFKDTYYHNKEFRPVWNESSPIFGISQSCLNAVNKIYQLQLISTNNHTIAVAKIVYKQFGISLKEAKKIAESAPILLNVTSDNEKYNTIKNALIEAGADISEIIVAGDNKHSLYYWFKQKQDNNIISPTDLTIKNNLPAISEITHTSYDRPTYGRLDHTEVGYLAHNNIGSNTMVSTAVNDNVILCNSNDDIAVFDPTLQYNLISLNCINENDEQITYTDNIKAFLVGDPISNRLLLNLNNDTHSSTNEYNYITYKTSKIHKLWLSPDKQDVTLSDKNTLYNSVGSDNLFYFVKNTVTINYIVKGIYNLNNKLISTNATMTFKVNDLQQYVLELNSSENITAAYVLCIVTSVENKPA